MEKAPESKDTAKARRLAEALKANLKRRKRQRRERLETADKAKAPEQEQR